MKYSLLISFVTISLFSFSQKIEKERRVYPADVPEPAVEWFDQLEIDMKHPKWFAENTSGKKSFEVKFIHLRELYSIEFDSTGIVEDVEILKKKKHLDKKILKVIENDLDKYFEKAKVIKIQFQYSSKDTYGTLLKLLNDQNYEDIVLRYEIEFDGRINGKWKMYEGTFDNEGKLLKTRKIIIRSTENLNY